MSYNILTGGVDQSPVNNRLNNIIELINQQKPDVLVLQEANKFDDDDLMAKFSKAIGLPHYYLAHGAVFDDMDRYHCALFSRFPVNEVHHFENEKFQNAAIAATIDSGIGKISICGLHLHAFSEDERIKELRQIFSYKKDYHLLLGDFNAISRRDEYTVKTSEFDLRYEVTDWLDQHYIDVLGAREETRTPTFPSEISVNVTYRVPRRIDYMFATKQFNKQITGAKVIKTNLTNLASDHFPVIINIKNS